nr:hypothetical protein BaRGS_007387 [Batillaria attramentaria]
MTIWILSKPNMGMSAVLVYFKALAVSDLCLLYSGLLRNWIRFFFKVELRDTFTVVCKVHIWVVYVTGMTSSWFLVAMTTQRAMSVVWPHRLQTACTRRSAKLTVAGIVMSSALVNAHNLYGYTLKYYESEGKFYCDYLDVKYEDFARGPWPWIDMTLSSLLPFLLLIASNAMLVWKVAASVRDIKRMAATPNMQEAVSQRKKRSTSLTFTLICLSATFFLLTSPLCAYLVSDHYLRYELESNPELKASSELAWAVTNILWYSNSAVNFYLYCLSGSRFRHHVLRSICCVRAVPDRATAGAGSLRTISALVVPPGRVVDRVESTSEF